MLKRVALLLALACLATSSLWANTINAGANPLPSFGSAIASTSVNYDFTAGGTLPDNTGTINEWVFSSTTDNPGGLVFVYQITNVGSGAGADTSDYSRLVPNVYTGFPLTVAYQTCTGCAAPNGQHNDINGNPGFDFGTAETATSSYLIVNTNATNYGPGGSALIDTATGNVTGLYAPSVNSEVTSTVPEPASMLLFGSGLTALASIIRRRTRR